MNFDTRWNDAGHIQISNGPARIVTPPPAPKSAPNSDGQIIEYLLPYPMHIIDNDSWRHINFNRNDVPITIHRPLSMMASYEPDGRMGNESPDAFCTIIRLQTPPGIQMDSEQGWVIIEKLAEWIRIKCRHYWVLHGISGAGSLYRSSIFIRNGRKVSQQNVAAYGQVVIVRPLVESLWLSIQDELQSNAEIPMAESVFCDALLSVAAGDEMKAVLEAGVAAEIAITQLLLEICDKEPQNVGVAEFRKERGDFHPFSKKLTEWPQRLNLEPASKFHFHGMPPSWTQTVQELYTFRSSIAHSGKLKMPASSGNIKSCLFAVGALLEYCRVQRSGAGLRNYSMPPPHTPFNRIVACHDGVFTMKTNACEGVLS